MKCEKRWILIGYLYGFIFDLLYTFPLNTNNVLKWDKEVKNMQFGNRESYKEIAIEVETT